MARRLPATIALLSDFGYRDHYVGVMKGVIGSITPDSVIVDLTHGIPPQQLTAGAIALAQSWRFFPRNTVFVAVVDPGVGTARLPIAIKTKAGAAFVGPDNGLLSLAAADAGIKKIVELASERYRLPNPGSTFHGRDIFAPAAAWLAHGIKLDALGPRRDSIVRIDPASTVEEQADELRGEVIYIDGFGNLVSNLIRSRVEQFAERFGQGRLAVQVGRHGQIRLRRTYAEAEVGTPLALFGSFEMLEIAIRDGSAAARLKVDSGSVVTVKAAD